jgi:hypothetical protein
MTEDIINTDATLESKSPISPIFRLKDKDRIEIITDFIKTGKAREGYYIKETSGKSFQVRREKFKDRKVLIQRKIDKLKIQIHALEEELCKATDATVPAN